ncbi:NB-ARC domain disease resistance protein [Medicago truncatula]|uniref:NB-ARC domain disease resistance protein n=1 Tax=Medicago truncatula TaxID=3880 RepID=A0A072TJ90_MEDTR|nr:NB-ARC domain disease resistance protein [Medicago truncatula]
MAKQIPYAVAASLINRLKDDVLHPADDLLDKFLIEDLRHKRDEARKKKLRQHVSVVAIVGIGGLGKTTLAQLVYNDGEVKKSFGKSKRYLLVLDDIWNESFEKCSQLRTYFMCGAQGSKVVVTTRSKIVAQTMDTKVVNQTLETIGKNIVEKCSGVPLAKRTLGGMLQGTIYHDTEECHQLQEAIEDLIKKGKLSLFKDTRNPQDDERRKDSPLKFPKKKRSSERGGSPPRKARGRGEGGRIFLGGPRGSAKRKVDELRAIQATPLKVVNKRPLPGFTNREKVNKVPNKELPLVVVVGIRGHDVVDAR